MTSIIVASFHAEDAKNIRDMLTRNGYHVNIVCTSGANALSHAQNLQGGIVICSYKLQDMIYAQVLENMPPSFQMILLSSTRVLGGVTPKCDHIAIPFKLQELLIAIEGLMQAQALKAKKLRQQPKKRSEEEIQVIEKAKKALMDRRKMTEEEAHRLIQRRSMESQTSFVEMARMVLALYEKKEREDKEHVQN